MGEDIIETRTVLHVTFHSVASLCCNVSLIMTAVVGTDNPRTKLILIIKFVLVQIAAAKRRRYKRGCV